MTEPTAILVVEDDEPTRTFLADNLTADGYDLLVAATLSEALRTLEYHRVDLAVVDLGLPDGSGLELLRKVRESGGVGARLDERLPLIVLSGRAGETDRVRGFERGADDFLSKPFSYGELRLRVAALLRRARERPSEGRLRVGGLELDPVAREVRRSVSRSPRYASSKAPGDSSRASRFFSSTASPSPVTIALCGTMPDVTPSNRSSLVPAGRLTRRVSLTRA